MTAKPGEVPGGVVEEHGSLLVTVEAIDEANGTATVKAPDGTVETVKAKNPANLKRLKVGDDLVITLDSAIAIHLEKALLVEMVPPVETIGDDHHHRRAQGHAGTNGSHGRENGRSSRKTIAHRSRPVDHMSDILGDRRVWWSTI